MKPVPFRHLADVVNDPKKFVIAWQSSDSCREVARKLGCRTSCVTAAAQHLRRIGVQLKFMTRRIKKIDAQTIAGLNKLARRVEADARAKSIHEHALYRPRVYQ